MKGNANLLDLDEDGASLDAQGEEDVAGIGLDAVDDEPLLGAGDVVLEGSRGLHGVLVLNSTKHEYSF